jgi:hypothetical protein
VGTLATRETLSERVDDLIRAHRVVDPLLATTTTHEAIQELIARSEGLTKAVREIALEVEELSRGGRRRVAMVSSTVAA